MRNFELRAPSWLVSTIVKKRLRMLFLVALMVSVAGLWTHSLYAARIRAQKTFE
jgi:hypothetical protein